MIVVIGEDLKRASYRAGTFAVLALGVKLFGLSVTSTSTGKSDLQFNLVAAALGLICIYFLVYTVFKIFDDVLASRSIPSDSSVEIGEQKVSYRVDGVDDAYVQAIVKWLLLIFEVFVPFAVGIWATFVTRHDIYMLVEFLVWG